MAGLDSPLASIDVCGAEADGCICFLAPHSDDQVHYCREFIGDRPCGAAWYGQWGTDTFEPVLFPGGEPA